ncbi:MAG: DNA ligase D [Polyangiaceae bacterium]|nr:DNA ligase D [Polyangiaceae bacterium]
MARAIWTGSVGFAAGLPGEAFLLDGELVALNERGVSDFQVLQHSLKVKSDSELCYFAFDLLHLNGTNTRGFSLLQRKELLRALLAKRGSKNAPLIRLSDHVTGGGPEFFLKTCEEKLEGIISKRALSPYRSGRGRDWLKVKCLMRQELVVVGFTEPKGGRSHLGALLLGVWRGAELVYVGRVGTGFSERTLLELHSRLSHLVIEKSAVKHQLPRAQLREVSWVQPKLVAEVGFTGFTSDGLLRHPTFVGLREDKEAEEVHLETAATNGPNSAAGLGASPPKRPEKAAVSSDTGYVITHPDKLLYHDAKITKRELLDYYGLVGERMLPHLARRPLTLVRCPNGQGQPCFFQKHFAQGAPPGVHSISGSDGNEPYPFVESEEGLFGLAQLGALEIHTWGSRVDNLEHPDILVFDLDPDPELPFQAVIEAAKELRAVFATAKLESFVKTTGGKGLHVCLPVAPSLDWKEAKTFSGEVAHALVAQSPKRYVATQSKSKRTGKIFIDYLRNGRGATFVAPYSTRARPNAPVAMPLEWEELTPKLRADQFTLRNVRERLKEADPFARLFQCKQQLPEVKRGSRA